MPSNVSHMRKLRHAVRNRWVMGFTYMKRLMFLSSSDAYTRVLQLVVVYAVVGAVGDVASRAVRRAANG